MVLIRTQKFVELSPSDWEGIDIYDELTIRLGYLFKNDDKNIWIATINGGLVLSDTRDGFYTLKETHVKPYICEAIRILLAKEFTDSDFRRIYSALAIPS